MLGGRVAYESLAKCSVQSTTQLRKAQTMVLYDKKEIVRHSVSKSFPSRGRIGCLQVRAEATVITECVPQNKAED